MGRLTDYAKQLIDRAEARRKKLASDWIKNTKGKDKEKNPRVLQPLIEIPLKTAPAPKENHGAPALEKPEPPPRPEIPLEPIDEVIRFSLSCILIYPGMDK